MNIKYDNDERIVMTLDAGGTNLKFSAIQGNRLLMDPIYIPTEGDNLEKCLLNIINGFSKVHELLIKSPVAISFAFPGPADYPSGIIGDLPNLKGFRGGVALGPMLMDKFHIPVFINNDGDLFAYGESIAGFLPYVNDLLEKAGSKRRHGNLFGVTIGTGFGGGIVYDRQLFIGDNSIGGEAWLLRNKLNPLVNAEEGACINAVKNTYAELTGIPPEQSPEPKEIFEIGTGKEKGNKVAAIEAFRKLGEVAGDAIAQALTLIDGLAVIGGGLSSASQLFMPALIKSLNDVYQKPGGNLKRLIAQAYDIDDPEMRDIFLKGAPREINVPESTRKVHYDPLLRTAIGVTRLGTSKAVAIGAYSFALTSLDNIK